MVQYFSLDPSQTSSYTFFFFFNSLNFSYSFIPKSGQHPRALELLELLWGDLGAGAAPAELPGEGWGAGLQVPLPFALLLLLPKTGSICLHVYF